MDGEAARSGAEGGGGNDTAGRSPERPIIGDARGVLRAGDAFLDVLAPSSTLTGNLPGDALRCRECVGGDMNRCESGLGLAGTGLAPSVSVSGESCSGSFAASFTGSSLSSTDFIEASSFNSIGVGASSVTVVPFVFGPFTSSLACVAAAEVFLVCVILSVGVCSCAVFSCFCR